MRKIGLIMAIIIWTVTAGKYIKKCAVAESTLAGAFGITEYSYISAKIAAYGEYDVKLDTEAMEKFVRNIACDTGIASPDIRNDGERIICEKASENADFVMTVIPQNDTNHISLVLDLKDNIESAETYDRLIKEVFEAEHIEGNVNLYFEGRISGMLNYEEKNYVADEMLTYLSAKTVTESRENETYTIYAYTDRIENYVRSIGRKININITASYDEINNETVIYLATPLNNLDY